MIKHHSNHIKIKKQIMTKNFRWWIYFFSYRKRKIIKASVYAAYIAIANDYISEDSEITAYLAIKGGKKINIYGSKLIKQSRIHNEKKKWTPQRSFNTQRN